MMAKIRARILSAVLVAVCGCGSDWTVLRQPDSGFIVAMPDSETCGTDRDVTAKGAFAGHSCVAQLGRSFFVRPLPAWFVVSWSDRPPGLDARELEPVFRELAIRAVPPGNETTERSAERRRRWDAPYAQS